MMPHRGWLKTHTEIAGMDRRAMTSVVDGAMVPELARTHLAVPAKVRLGPDRVEWIPGTDDDPEPWWREGEIASKALWEFIRLATEFDEQRFVNFARRYGVLGLTEDGLPSVSRTDPGLGGPGQLAESWNGFAVSWESIPAWRVYAANAKAVMYLAMELRQGGTINAARVLKRAGPDSASLGPQWPSPSWESDGTGGNYTRHLLKRRPEFFLNLDRPGHNCASHRKWIAGWVTNFWIAHSALIPTVVWEDERPRLALPIGRRSSSSWEYGRPPNMLFNILAAHQAAFICSREPVATCGHCGTLHPRSRKPRADQPAYCAACKPEAEKERNRRWKARQRS